MLSKLVLAPKSFLFWPDVLNYSLSIMVSPGKHKSLEQRLEKLGVLEDHLIEKFIKGSGKGGQKINKSSTCVFLLHKPSGIEVKCQKTRSLQDNRYHARKLLAEKIEEEIEGIKSARQREIAKKRRQKQKRSKRAQEKVFKEKKQRSEIKQTRKRPEVE